LWGYRRNVRAFVGKNVSDFFHAAWFLW
jgi:hypothetical protein